MKLWVLACPSREQRFLTEAVKPTVADTTYLLTHPHQYHAAFFAYSAGGRAAKTSFSLCWMYAHLIIYVRLWLSIGKLDLTLTPRIEFWDLMSRLQSMGRGSLHSFPHRNLYQYSKLRTLLVWGKVLRILLQFSCRLVCFCFCFFCSLKLYSIQKWQKSFIIIVMTITYIIFLIIAI